MDLSPPRPGEVIRYAYLWTHEAAEGRTEGVKDRPCAVVLAVRGESAAVRVVVAPISHSPPAADTPVVELPASVKERLGLDEEQSWVVCAEVNEFVWPGPDLRLVPGAKEASIRHGFLPAKVFGAVTSKLVSCARERRLRQTRRSP